MPETTKQGNETQKPPCDAESTRSKLDVLLEESRLYTRSKDFKDLLAFVIKLRNFAPYNAMLLQVQKPGLSYAATAEDWRRRFKRKPKEGARPLLILWPFGPVSLVYDVMDTEGAPLPQDVATFYSVGLIDDARLESFRLRMAEKHIEWVKMDAGDARAGWIRTTSEATKVKPWRGYRVAINQNHSAPVQFSSLAHELAHLFLGHLGLDKVLNAPDQQNAPEKRKELEAESVAYLVCERNGVKCKSQTYLANYVDGRKTMDQLDVYAVMRAAGQVETLLGLVSKVDGDTRKSSSHWGAMDGQQTLSLEPPKQGASDSSADSDSGKSSLGALLDAEFQLQGARITKRLIENGTRRFADYMKAVFVELGPKAKPWLTMWYLAARAWPAFDPTGMDDEATVKEMSETLNQADVRPRPMKTKPKPQGPESGRLTANQFAETAINHYSSQSVPILMEMVADKTLVKHLQLEFQRYNRVFSQIAEANPEAGGDQVNEAVIGPVVLGDVPGYNPNRTQPDLTKAQQSLIVQQVEEFLNNPSLPQPPTS